MVVRPTAPVRSTQRKDFGVLSAPGRRRTAAIATAAAVATSFAVTSCSDDGQTLTIYSGRTENLIAPILEDFAESTGIDVEVRYGQSADLALLIDQEGERSPADVFLSQSPGAIGFLAEDDRLVAIPSDTLELVDPSLRSSAGTWVGMSGRIRTLVYNSDLVDPATLPASVLDLTDERFRGQVALAPANGSFQDFVTALRETQGDDVASEWLAGMAANDAQVYADNTAIVQAVGRGEVPMGLVNHYYNHRAKAEDPSLPTENYFFPNGDIGALLLTTAIGVVDTADDVELADRLVSFMLGEKAQTFFSEESFEYPLAAGVEPAAGLPPLSDVEVATFDVDGLGGGLGRTLELIEGSGLDG
jgi:iron(III) transport system substrate-binding protein